MKITYLGQAGLLINIGDKNVIVDPYLSNSVERVEPYNRRRVPVDTSFFDIRPDIMLLTHNHLDHTDPETLVVYLKKYSNITVLAPKNAWNTAKSFGNGHNYILMNRHTRRIEGKLCISAVKAEHSDSSAVGYIIDDGNVKLYITGDTLYNEDIFADIPSDIHALFLPINGVGNNMNMDDAARFAERIGAKYVIPLHVGMFDDLDPNEFKCKNKIIPKIYEEIKLG